MIGSTPIGAAAIADNGAGGLAPPRPPGFYLVCEPGRLALAIREIPPQKLQLELIAEPATLQMVVTAQPPNRFALVAEAPTLSMFFGGRFALAAELPQLTMSGTVPGVMRAELVAELPGLQMSGTAGHMMRMGLVAQPGAFAMRTGARFALVAELPTLQLSGTVGRVLRASLVAQPAALAMSISPAAVMRMVLVAQPLQAVPSMRAGLVAPLARLELGFSRLVAATDYEAYAVNLTKERAGQPYEVTHYTGMPFTRVLRYRGAYYGLSSTGLYKLGGDTDAGAIIPSEWESHLEDFGKTKKKTAEALFVSGRLSETVVATLIEGEVARWPVPMLNVRGAGAQVYRVKFGRGIKASYLGFGLADPAGGVMDVATLTDKTPAMSRSI